MNEKNLKKLKKLYQKAVTQISQSSEAYNRFLKTAAHNYRLSFRNAVAAFAQGVDKDLLLTYDQWQMYGRVPKRYSKSTLMFDRLVNDRYVVAYALSTTVVDKRVHRHKELRFFDYENKPEILNVLQNIYHSDKDSIKDILYDNASRQFENILDDSSAFGNQTDFFAKSVTNMLLNRFGEEMPYTDFSPFEGINQNNLSQVYQMVIDVYRAEFSKIANEIPKELEKQKKEKQTVQKDYNSYTPLAQEFFKAKSANPEALVVIRVGDFYEALGEDANIIAEQLELTLTGRMISDSERVPMCGFPAHRTDEYINKLNEKGYNVGVLTRDDNGNYQVELRAPVDDEIVEPVTSVSDGTPEPISYDADTHKPYQVITYAGDDGGFDEKLEYATLDKATVAGRIYISDGYLGFSVYNRDTHRIELTEGEFNIERAYSDEVLKINNIPIEKLPTEEENFILPPEKPSITLTQQDIDRLLIQDPAIKDCKLRIYAAFQENMGEKRIIDILRQEYKDSGGVIHSGKKSFLRNSNRNGIFVIDVEGDYAPTTITFKQIHQRIGELINENRYLNQRELQEYEAANLDVNAISDFYVVSFSYKVGDVAYLHGVPYMISDVSDSDVTVYQEEAPLLIEKYPKQLFEDMLNVNAADNRKLLVRGAVTYEIYQLVDNESARETRFSSLHSLQKRGLKVEPANYEKVYSGKLKQGENLETLYERFNIHHPDDFTGHSLSVSDVVVLKRNEERHAYYCDDIGFPEIPEFLVQNIDEYILFNPEDRTISWIYFNPDGNNGSGQIVHENISVDDLSKGIQAVSIDELPEFFSQNGVQRVWDIDNHDNYVKEYDDYINEQPSGLKYAWNPQMSAEDYEAFKNMIVEFATASTAVSQPQVVINFSEHPALYEYSHKKTRLRFPFANELLGRLDMLENAKRENPEVGFYYKTDFEIYTSVDGIHLSTYNGRYDLADGETDIIGHISAYADFARESYNEIEDNEVYVDESAYNNLLDNLQNSLNDNPLTEREKAEIERIVTQDYGLDIEAEVEPKTPDYSDLIGKEVEYADKRFRVSLINQFNQAHLEDISSLSVGNVPVDTVLPVETVKNLIDNQNSVEAENFVIENNNIGVGTPLQRFNNNLAAIKVLHNLQNESRPATHSEQLVLSQYVGWGGLSDFFKEQNAHNQELRQLLSENDYNSAYDSVLTSFYTPPVVIKSMYKALYNLGFTNGSILDPACGTGHFFGSLPDYMQNGTRLYGTEIDNVSGQIAKALYPNANIKVMGFEETNIPDNYIDVVVGNVPFGDFQVYDPKYNKNHLLIHDYFFIKSLDKVRPGGIVAFVTSTGTLDKKTTKVREMIADKADLLGAIRLPNNTFKSAAGTDVSSDMIFLQKRSGAELVKDYPDWVYTSSNADGIEMNNYFIAHPEMVCGKMVLKSSQFGMDSVCVPVEGSNLNDALNQAIQNIQGTYIPYSGAEENEDSDSIVADESARNYSYFVKDDTVYYRENGIMTVSPYEGRKADRIKGMVELADVTRELIRAESTGESDDVVNDLRNRLNEVYDNFYNLYGSINSLANSVFKKDNSYSLLCSLETLTADEITEETIVKKADIFTKRTISPRIEIVSAENSEEALIISVSQKGKVDLDYMSRLTGNSTEQIINELNGSSIFLKPYEGEYVTADEYLSGNVREKLKTARLAAKEDSKYQVNVQALEGVQPKDIPASEISVRLGTTWIPEKYYNDFLTETFEPIYDEIEVQYNSMMGNYYITGKTLDNFSVQSINRFGTVDRNGYKILEDSLNLKTSEVRETHYVDGKEVSVINREKTLLVQNKQELLKNKFKEWIYKEPNRRRELERIYNDKFNCIVPRHYDGSHLTFAGINPNITLREHQLNAIARMLYGGNTLLAHQVGAGKTFEMCAGAMKLKELGLAHKSIICVPKHLTSQTGAEFLRLFPAANVLVAEEKDFTPKNRKRFCTRIATGDYDAIIIGHTQLEKIPLKPDTQMEIFNEQLNEIVSALEEAQGKGLAGATVKSLARTKKQVEKKLKELEEKSLKKDDVIYFEELGVDQIFVDEAHLFKNLFIYTKMTNVAGVSSGRESGRASDLYSKICYLNHMNPGKGVVFATGTPIANSISEMYIMQRYLQPQMLQSMGLMNFDSWATTFGETVTSLEIAPEGSGYRAKTRFAKFNNIPELMAMFKEVADIQTSETLNLPVPDVDREIVEAKPTDEQKKMIEDLGERAEKIRIEKTDPRIDNILKIISDGKAIALDPRVFSPELERGNKVDECANRIFDIWSQSTDKTQVVFCDLSTPSAKGQKDFCVYEYLKSELVSRGIPDKEIQFIQDYKSSKAKQKLFADVRKSKVRVLIGSTEMMGTGMNIQNKLVSLHHLDCPNRPADIEQREGRIIRQGNTNPTVQIYNYVTKGTFDAFMYQMVERKQKFISSVMTAKHYSERSVDDIDEATLNYGQIKAVASDNPLVMRKFEIDNQVNKLTSIRNDFINQQRQMEDEVELILPQRIHKLQIAAENYKADLAFAEQHPEPEDFDIEIAGKHFDSRSEALEAIVEQSKRLNGNELLDVGHYRGFKLYLYKEATWKFSTLYDLCMTVKNQAGYRVEIEPSKGIGNFVRINNAISHTISEKFEATVNEISVLQNRLEAAKAEINQEFPQESEYQALLKEQSEINIELTVGDNKPDSETTAKNEVLPNNEPPSTKHFIRR